MMDIASDKIRTNWRKAGVKTAFIVGANLSAAGLITWVTATLTGADAFHPGGPSVGLAALVGWLHVSFGSIAVALRASARFLDDTEEAEELRREGRALMLGAGALIAAGVALILLSLAGPDRPVPPAVGASGALALNALAMILVAIRWQGLDELNRAVAREAGYLAFSWVSLVGGTWAMLAHLGFVVAPAPLDWLTMLSGFSFVAGLVALARRGGFERA